MTPDNKKLFAGMVGIANTYKNSTELLEVVNDMVSRLAANQGVKRPNSTDNLNFDEVVITRIVIYAINIEILLKAIYLFDNDQTMRGHEWAELYNHLSESRKQEIRNSMPEKFRSDFDELLNKNGDSFVRWRYCYEHDNMSCDLSFVNELSNTLGKIVLSLTD